MPSFVDRHNHARWWILPLIIWAILVVAVTIRVSLAPVKRGSVYPVFATAGQAFAEGKPLYGSHEGAFRYSPGWATFFSIAKDVPQQVASMVWRMLNLAVFIWAAYRFQRQFFSHWSNSQLCLWWCFMFPFCLGSFNNAQANLLLLGLMMAAIVTFANGRWTLCAIVLALAISLKVYPIALALLLVMLQPMRLFLPLLISIIAVLALPFAFQDSNYVLEQYQSWYRTSAGDLRIDKDISDTNRDLWMLIRISHAPLEYRAYQILQLLAALGLAVWTWFSRSKLLHQPMANVQLIKLFSLAITWMLVLGPASESSTYALVAPTLAMAGVLILTTQQSLLTKILVTLSFLLMLVAHLGSAFPNGTVPHEYGIHPIATMILALAVQTMSLPPRNPQTLPGLTAT